jgi:hypothetical protein
MSSMTSGASLDRFKLSQHTWDSDKHPARFYQFMTSMSAMVRSINHGAEVEDYLDKKLDRRRSEHLTVPSFISDDPDFAPMPTLPDEDEDPPSSAASTSLGTESNTTIGSAALGSAGSYWSLSEEARQLDAMLYSILQMSVTGSKNILITCCGGVSYIKAMCVLSRHSDISRNDRMTKAFTVMDDLKFSGDVRVWQTDAVSAIRELLDSQASIMHYMLTRVMKSFKGNLKTVQYRIADEINSTTVDEKYNIFDMIQKVATDIASVGDSTQQRVTTTKGKGKGKGGKKGGFKGKGARSPGKGKGNGGSGVPGVAGPGSQCHNCGGYGHFARDCTKPKTGEPGQTTSVAAQSSHEQSDQVAAGLAALQQQLQANALNHVSATPYQNTSGGWGHRGERIGEASHPGPPAKNSGYARRLFNNSKGLNCAAAVKCLTMTCTVLSLCDGMGCAALALQNSNAQIERYVAVELDYTARLVAQHANQVSDKFPGIDHSVANDVYHLTEQTIIDLGPIQMFIAAPPCGDFSKLRLLPSCNVHALLAAAATDDDVMDKLVQDLTTGSVTDADNRTVGDPRPGLDGPTGKVFKQVLLVWHWVLKHNPDCQYFVECVVFNDMPSHWNRVCNELGQPLCQYTGEKVSKSDLQVKNYIPVIFVYMDRRQLVGTCRPSNRAKTIIFDRDMTDFVHTLNKLGQRFQHFSKLDKSLESYNPMNPRNPRNPRILLNPNPS